jgi:hypothetical protein
MYDLVLSRPCRKQLGVATIGRLLIIWLLQPSTRCCTKTRSAPLELVVCLSNRIIRGRLEIGAPRKRPYDFPVCRMRVYYPPVSMVLGWNQISTLQDVPSFKPANALELSITPSSPKLIPLPFFSELTSFLGAWNGHSPAVKMRTRTDAQSSRSTVFCITILGVHCPIAWELNDMSIRSIAQRQFTMPTPQLGSCRHQPSEMVPTAYHDASL